MSDWTVARMLHGLGFSLQGNAKVIEGHQHEDRDAQLRYLAAEPDEHAGVEQPVISVDAKKRGGRHEAAPPLPSTAKIL